MEKNMGAELKQSEVSALRQACVCLYATVAEDVANDVKARAEALIAEHSRLKAENEALLAAAKATLAHLRTRQRQIAVTSSEMDLIAQLTTAIKQAEGEE